MGTPTYTPLANLTLSTASSSVTFSNISQAYSDIYMDFAIATSGGSNIMLRLNGDTSASYLDISWNNSDTNASRFQLGYNDVANVFSAGNVIFMQYTMTDRYRQIWGKIGQTQSQSTNMSVFGGTWNNGAAMTSFTFFPEGGQFNSGSVFTIYGVVR